jgi:hypothetical protein
VFLDDGAMMAVRGHGVLVDGCLSPLNRETYSLQSTAYSLQPAPFTSTNAHWWRGRAQNQAFCLSQLAGNCQSASMRRLGLVDLPLSPVSPRLVVSAFAFAFVCSYMFLSVLPSACPVCHGPRQSTVLIYSSHPSLAHCSAASAELLLTRQP